MSGRKVHEMPTPLARGRDRFEAWRRRRELGTRIPERLWKLAVKLASAHGLKRTASVLKLDYGSLKKRVGASALQGRSAAPAFVEIAPPPMGNMGECVIELEDSTGASMRVNLKGYAAPDLMALSSSFWNSE